MIVVARLSEISHVCMLVGLYNVEIISRVAYYMFWESPKVERFLWFQTIEGVKKITIKAKLTTAGDILPV